MTAVGSEGLSVERDPVQLHLSCTHAHAVCGWLSGKESCGQEAEKMKVRAAAQPIQRMEVPAEIAAMALYVLRSSVVS